MESFIFDELFDSVRDEEVSLVVLMADVTRSEISVRSEGGSSTLRVIQVTLKNVRPLDTEFAGLARCDFIPFGRDVFRREVGQKSANRPDGFVPFFPSLVYKLLSMIVETLRSN